MIEGASPLSRHALRTIEKKGLMEAVRISMAESRAIPGTVINRETRSLYNSVFDRRRISLLRERMPKVSRPYISSRDSIDVFNASWGKPKPRMDLICLAVQSLLEACSGSME